MAAISFCNRTNAQPSAGTGQLQRRGVAQKGKTPPFLVILRTFQQVTVTAGGTQRAHNLYRCKTVCQQFPAHRNPVVIPGPRQDLHFCQRWVHYGSSYPLFPGQANKKARPDSFTLSRTGCKFPRCHLALRKHFRTLCEIPTYFRQLTYAHTSQNTRPAAFPCALRGPFGSLPLDPAFTYPGSLYAHNCFDFRFNGLLLIFT